MALARVYLSLGSNLGDRLACLRAAAARLAGVLSGLKLSSVYETTPMYVTDQPRFLNCAAAGCTSLGPRELLEETQRIERELGRLPTRPKGPRQIDIDLLLHGSTCLRDERLELPHPGMRERAFVLVPLLELEPDLRDPATLQPYSRCLDSLEKTGVTYHRAWDAP